MVSFSRFKNHEPAFRHVGHDLRFARHYSPLASHQSRLHTPQQSDFSYRKMAGPEALCVTWPKPDPPWLPVAVPLPLEGCSAGPAAEPPPVTAVGGVPKVTGCEVSEPR